MMKIEYTPPMSPSHTFLAANGNQISMKRKSLSEDRDIEKKKKTKKTITPRSQGQSSKSLCGICLDSVIDFKIFTNTSCNHPFCIKCISKYVKVQRKEKVVKVNCPDPECSVELKPEHLQSILPKKVIVDWESAIYESSIVSRQKIYCPYKNCSLRLVNDGLEGVTSCECPSCHRLFCEQCEVPWHADMKCRQFQKSKKVLGEKQLDKKLVQLARSEMWQKCPKCSMHVEKIEGCDRIICSCGCSFCYNCGKKFKKGNFDHTCKISRAKSMLQAERRMRRRTFGV